MPDISLHQITLDSLSIGNTKQVEVSVLRLDKIDPLLSGNKWFKLRYYLEEAIQQGKKTVVTFGGAWSNHIIATAKASKLFNLSSIGIIRGERPGILSTTLKQAEELGMELHFVSREDYAEKRIPTTLGEDEYYLINEGGYGELGAKGASTIVDQFEQNNFSHICCATGTGTMLAGIRNAVAPDRKVVGISVMKNNLSLEEAVMSLLSDPSLPFTILHEYHFGGYAKLTTELTSFMNDFYNKTGIPTDIIYTAKLFFAVNDLIKKNYFPAGSHVLVIHSGGLQGNASLGKGTLIF